MKMRVIYHIYIYVILIKYQVKRVNGMGCGAGQAISISGPIINGARKLTPLEAG